MVRWKDDLLANDRWREMTVPALLQRAATVYGKRTALLNPESDPLTYAELFQKASDLALRLAEAGLAGKRIAILSPATPETVIAGLGVLLCGGRSIPLNPTLKEAEFFYQLGISKPAAVLSPRGSRKGFDREILGAAIASLDEQPAQIAISENESGAGWRWPPLPSSRNVPQWPQIAPTDAAHILFTSGSTANPKAVVLSHRGVVGSSVFRARSFDVDEDDAFCNLLALFHTGGLVAGFYTSMAAGIPMWVSESFEPLTVLKEIERHRLTTILGFNTSIEQTIGHPRAEEYDIGSLVKAATAPPGPFYDVLKRKGFKLVASCYELTEGSNMVCSTMPEDTDETVRRWSLGRPIPGVEVQVVDAEGGATVDGGGKIGELSFRGWNLMLGYLDETGRLKAESGWFRTGDSGSIKDGYVYYSGRYKDMIKSGGENVSALEIELKISEIFPDRIAVVSVIGLPDERWGERVSAVVQLAEQASLSADEIISACKQHVAGFKAPKEVRFISGDAWPRLGSGKIDKKALVRIFT